MPLGVKKPDRTGLSNTTPGGRLSAQQQSTVDSQIFGYWSFAHTEELAVQQQRRADKVSETR